MLFFRCSVIPHVSLPEMKENMRRLLDDAPESYDVKIQVKQHLLHCFSSKYSGNFLKMYIIVHAALS